MIVKVVPKKSSSKSSFAKLANYLLDEQLNKERVQSHAFENCNCETIEDNITEIRVTQEINTRAKSDKTYHFIVSFHEDEKPTPEVLKKIEGELVKVLGYEEHQRLSVIHGDTNNLHMHIAINKIHPETYLYKEPFRDMHTLQKKAVELEEKFRLKRDNHQTKGESKEPGHIKDKEIHSGVQSFYTWVKDNVTVELSQILKDETKTFIDLQKTLNKYNLELRERGAGFVISDKDRALYVKASDVSRDLSKGNLEKRFGVFALERVSDKSETKFGQKSKLWEEYKTQQATKRSAKKTGLDRIYGESSSKYKEIIDKYAEKRLAIKNNTTINRLVKKNAYSILHKQKQEELRKLKQETKIERNIVYSGTKTETYASFLITKAQTGNVEALQMLQHKRAKEREQFAQTKTKFLPGAEVKITKQGTIVYNLADGKIVDKGNKAILVGGLTPANTQALDSLGRIKFGKEFTNEKGVITKNEPGQNTAIEAFKQKIGGLYERRRGNIYAASDKGRLDSYLQNIGDAIRSTREQFKDTERNLRSSDGARSGAVDERLANMRDLQSRGIGDKERDKTTAATRATADGRRDSTLQSTITKDREDAGNLKGREK